MPNTASPLTAGPVPAAAATDLGSLKQRAFQDALSRLQARVPHHLEGKPITTAGGSHEYILTVRSLKPPNLKTVTREQTLEYFNNTWYLYETLMDSLADDSVYYRIANPLRRPLIFYLGHTASLYVNKLVIGGLIKESERINPHYEGIFAVGVDEMSWDDMNDDHFDWPTVPQVWDFRQKVYDLVKSIILNVDLTLPITWDHVAWPLFMGFEHERIHYETSSVLIHELPLECVKSPIGWTTAPTFGFPLENKMVRIPGGQVTLGKRRDFPQYGWDNEYGEKTVKVETFEVSRFKVTNAEWLLFINAGGYDKRELWDEEGWQWCEFRRKQNNHMFPHFWIPIDASKYRYRSMYDTIDMPWDWPVEVNCHEARAYVRWKGEDHHLMTEAEFRRMTDFVPSHPDDDINWREEIPYNLQLEGFHSSTPVNFYPPNRYGVYDAMGNVWEWGSDTFDGYPGFKVHYLYLDFSTPCFDDRHNMIMGGAWVSTGNEASIYARFAFRRHFFQHAGFRVARRVPQHELEENMYESSKILREYLFFHFGTPERILPWKFGPRDALDFPVRCAQILAENADPSLKQTALDVGCAVGRSTMEMLKDFDSVVGVDYSQRFADVADQLARDGAVGYRRVKTGDHIVTEVAVAPAGTTQAYQANRIQFMRGDAMALPSHLASFDAVLAANLLDRLTDPYLFLTRCKTGLIKKGGVLVITTPFTWGTQFTPRNKWLLPVASRNAHDDAESIEWNGKQVSFVDVEAALSTVNGTREEQHKGAGEGGGVNGNGSSGTSSPSSPLSSLFTSDTVVDGEKREEPNLESLAEFLQGDFEFVKMQDEPFLIPEHERKFQWSVACVTVWRKL